MEKKNIDWANLGFGYTQTDWRYVTNYKNGAWDEGGLTADATFDSPLFSLPNFIVTPHLGAQSVDASIDIGKHIIAKVKEALEIA